jgi:membrane-bound inhibitor of C-type lysozyme
MTYDRLCHSSLIVRQSLRGALFSLGLLGSALGGSATNLTIRLPDNPAINRKTVAYTCDADGAKIGVPAGSFSVEYINGGGNSLAVVPISGKLLIFSNVIAASGARYTAQVYTWWEAHGQVTLTSDALDGKTQSTCVPSNRE